MNLIKTFAIFIIASLAASCSKDDYKLGSDIDPFVRFNFLVNSNNIPLEYPAVNGSLVSQSNYVNSAIRTLKIPVALTARSLKNPVTVNFSATSSTGNIDGFKINPVSELVFQGAKLTDTIFISFDKRWASNQSISLKLESASDPDVHIGNLNTEHLDDTFKIDLATVSTNYTFPVNQHILKGELGEKFDFTVSLPNGYFPSELENLQIFKFQNGFEYSLTHDSFQNDKNSVTYHFTLLEDLQNDDVRFQSKINLITTSNYRATGNTSFTIVKPQKSKSDVLTNPASKFYDLNVSNYLTYGVNWFDRNGSCVWQAFNAQTFPIVVTKDDPNAILYSDKGTTNPNDDVYHDAFKIGFRLATGTNTTNSFNLKRWFTNASSSATNSPGFNINPALEFFPENGNSKTNGTVLVIPQDITITATGGTIEKPANSYSISIEGEGTYKEISAGLFEISFELKLTNQELFGGTVTGKYKIYNKNTFPTAVPLNEPCRTAITL
ncbi:hypothetical protein [Flavobacterium sp. RS13.1]|uniref:hypothetical protein n=1 Tax=Flavobacterium sp. RS13.1 TaxID=3400345 RepID=UPI003AAD3E75